MRRLSNVFSPRERLEAFQADFDMIGPLLAYNVENIKTYRADCKYAGSGSGNGAGPLLLICREILNDNNDNDKKQS